MLSFECLKCLYFAIVFEPLISWAANTKAIVNTFCQLVTPTGLYDKEILCILFSVSIHKFWTHKKHVTNDTYHVSFVTLFLWVQNLICALPLLSYDSDVGNTILYICPYDDRIQLTIQI